MEEKINLEPKKLERVTNLLNSRFVCKAKPDQIIDHLSQRRRFQQWLNEASVKDIVDFLAMTDF